VQLQQNNLGIFQEGIPLEDLSKTFKEAFIAARRLGFQYIWIDSLCIIQDAKADWEKEASTMADVYAGSGLNFAATAAENGTKGCFFKHNPRLLRPLYIKIKKDPRVYLLAKHGLWEEAVESSPLARRGWIVQERILARRTLHFGANQLFWECGKHRACETFPESSSFHSWGMSRKGLGESLEAEQEWQDIVRYYSGTHLTVATDKRVAISGVAKSVQRITDDQYVAGLWRTNLEDQLLWWRNSNPGVSHAPKMRPSLYRAPSWSWASIDGPIHWWSPGLPGPDGIPRITDQPWTDLISVTDVLIEPTGFDPLGAIKSAKLRIQCRPLLIGRLSLTPEPGREPEIRIAGGEVFNASFDEMPEFEENGESFLMLAVKTRSFFVVIDPEAWLQLGGLLLKPTGLQAGEYRRVGTFDVRTYHAGFRDTLRAIAVTTKDSYEHVPEFDDTGTKFVITLV